MYTIGQVSEMFDLPISTLRYYDKEGLFPNLERTSGIRKFSNRELDRLNMIECLKLSGLRIDEIRVFMQWCEEGSSTYEKRLGLLMDQKKNVEAEIERLEEVLDMLRFKCWYYEEAIKDGNEERVRSMKPDKYPEEVQKLYDHGHTRAAGEGKAEKEEAKTA